MKKSEMIEKIEELGGEVPETGSGTDGNVLVEDIQAVLNTLTTPDDGPSVGEYGEYKPATYPTKSGAIREDR